MFAIFCKYRNSLAKIEIIEPFSIHFSLFGVGILIPNLVGFASGFVTKDAVTSPWYKSLRQPPFNPPNWVFPVVWTIMYSLMGVASVLVYKSGDHSDSWHGFNSTNKIPLALYGGQLLLNGLWPLIFFYFKQPFLALVEIVILDALIIATTISFWTVSTSAGWLLVPYVGWSLFATLLNYSTWLLNYDIPKPTNSTKYMNIDNQLNNQTTGNAKNAYGSFPSFTP